MIRGILKSRKKTLLLALILSAFFGVITSQASFAQEGRFASYSDAAAKITYDYVYHIARGANSDYSGPSGQAPNFYGGDIAHASSATCGMSFLMKPGYKIMPYDRNDSSITAENIRIVKSDNLEDEVDFGIGGSPIYGNEYYVRATWAIISYPDKSADLVMFGNTEGRAQGPDECGTNGNQACGLDYEWAYSCKNLFSDDITVSEYSDAWSDFVSESTSDLSAVGHWQPASPYGNGGCTSSHFTGSFESHATCTMVNPYVHDSLTAEQRQAAAAAITYDQQTQEDQCGGVVGFFTCPLAESMSNFLKTVYDVFSSFFLNIDPAVFSGNRVGTPGYAIHKAWNSFRNIANAMLVAALLIVILSQISGFGITNYGIKKSLPKIVIAALMVNLSYIICQGAIDLSNIFGHRIGDIFEGMLNASGGPITSDSFQGSTIATLIFVLIGVVVAVIHFGARIWVSLIILLLVCAVAMFIMLAVSVIRQALCILLVVVSPVALCCYMVPGTKSVFNKWFSMFKGVLIAYPMTSLVVYGSSYASSILLKAWGFKATTNLTLLDYLTTFLQSIAGLLIVTVPYFFIPKIIMKSLTALEGISSRIGSALIRNTTGAVRGSAFAQRQNDTQEFRRNVRHAGLHYNRRTGTVENRRRPGNNAVTRAFARVRDAYYNHPSRAMYARNANAMAAQRRRGRSYLTGDNQLDQILQDRSGDSADLLREKAALRRRLAFNRRMGLSTAGIRRRVNRMFGAGGEFESFTPQAFRDESGNYTGVRDDFQNTQENINNSTQNQRTREYIKQIEAQSGLTEESMSDSIIDAANSGNAELTSAYITVLLGNGEAGRDALLQCLRTNGLSDAALETIANSVSVAEMNDIKKKDRYLFNRIQAIQRNHAIGAGNMNNDANFRMNCQDIRSMSAKQFSEMDVSAQNRLIDEITDPNIYGAGTGYNPEDGIVAAAANLAEEILSDPSLRGTISAERLSNLENIVRIREDAVNQSVRTNRTADLAAINGMSTTNAAGQKLVDTTGMDFVNGITGNSSALRTQYVEAAKNGDTIRMESIQIAIESKYRENLRNAGVTLSEDAEAMMLATLQEVYTRLNSAVDDLRIENPNHPNDVFNGANDDERRLNRDARDGFVDLLNGRMDRRRKNMRR